MKFEINQEREKERKAGRKEERDGGKEGGKKRGRRRKKRKKKLYTNSEKLLIKCSILDTFPLGEFSLEGLMLKLKLQYFGHLMRRANSLEKTLMLAKIEGRGEEGDRR